MKKTEGYKEFERQRQLHHDKWEGPDKDTKYSFIDMQCAWEQASNYMFWMATIVGLVGGGGIGFILGIAIFK